MAEFNKEELFARWKNLSKSELENLRRTLSDGEEIAAFDEFLSLQDKEEILDIINGVQNSETEADYFASMDPKLNEVIKTAEMREYIRTMEWKYRKNDLPPRVFDITPATPPNRKNGGR